MRTVTVFLAVSLFLVSCGGGGGGNSSTGDTTNQEGPGESTASIILGVAGAHSGDLASYGLPTINAAELVAEKFNASGGVLGRTVEVLSEDDACKPEQATNVAHNMVDENVNFVLGHTCSGATEAALPVYTDNNIIVISPSATNSQLTISGDNPTFFRTIAPDNSQAMLSVEFATEELGATKIAILHDNSDYGRGYAEFAQSYITNQFGVEVVLFEGIVNGAVDYTVAILKVEQTEADCVLFGGYHPEASRIIEQMRMRELDIPFIADDGVKDEQFIISAGQFAEGVYVTGPTNISSNTMYQAATEDHLSMYGNMPGAFFYNSYAAAMVLLAATEKAGSTNADDIMEVLRSDTVDTPLGPISFDEKGDVTGFGFSIYQVQDAVYVELSYGS